MKKNGEKPYHRTVYPSRKDWNRLHRCPDLHIQSAGATRVERSRGYLSAARIAASSKAPMLNTSPLFFLFDIPELKKSKKLRRAHECGGNLNSQPHRKENILTPQELATTTAITRQVDMSKKNPSWRQTYAMIAEKEKVVAFATVTEPSFQ